jgi:hypothetical protein
MGRFDVFLPRIFHPMRDMRFDRCDLLGRRQDHWHGVYLRLDSRFVIALDGCFLGNLPASPEEAPEILRDQDRRDGFRFRNRYFDQGGTTPFTRERRRGVYSTF